MNEYYVLLTPQGEAELLEALTNNTAFTPSYIAVGDSNGSYYEPEKSQTALKNETYRGEIYAQGKHFKESENGINYLYCVMQIPPSIGDFVIREAGLFNSHDELLAIAKYPLLNKLKSDSWFDRTVSIEIQIALSDNAINTIIIDNSGNLATDEKIETAKQEVIEIIDEKIDNLPEPTSGLSFFDLVYKDHALSYKETKGLAQLGSYVYKEPVAGSRYGYPDFYSKVIEEYQDENNTTETVEGITITINSNGHKFYNIADKSVIDDIYSNTGEAWYYGIDTINERVFLPRSTRFKNAQNAGEVGGYQQEGLPNITGSVDTLSSWTSGSINPKGAFSKSKVSLTNSVPGGGFTEYQWLVDFDASQSNSIYGNSDTVEYSSTKLIPYMVVGNTIQESAITDVVDVTTSENDTVPLFFGAYFDFTPNNPSWLISGGQANSSGIYETAYNELVNVLQGETKYGSLKVIEETDMISGVDYSTYWIVNQDDKYFICPTKISYDAVDTDNTITSSVYGTGKTLGLTNGTVETGLNVGTWQGVPSITFIRGHSNVNVGSALINDVSVSDSMAGVTTNPETSGLIGSTNLSGAKSTTAKLYFKVANAIENLELLDAGEVLEGLANVVPNNSSLIAGYAMPSDKYIVLTVGASGTIYTAPADGYFGLLAYTANSTTTWIGSLYIRQPDGSTMARIALTSYSYSNGGAFVPVKKGMKIQIEYQNTVIIERIRFFYAEGSKGE